MLAAALALFLTFPLSAPRHALEAAGGSFWATALVALALAWAMRRDAAIANGR
jgi:MYXO-CTERM domain-containing protein